MELFKLTKFFSLVPGEKEEDFMTRRDAIWNGLRATLKEMEKSESIPMPKLEELFEVKKSKLGGFGLFAKRNVEINTRIPYLG